MPLKKDIANSLLQHNYLPIQKKNREEIPPIFSTRQLTESIAKKLAGTKPRIGGYDQVEYRSTRFNNVARRLSIPHPAPYSKLCLEIMHNWEKIDDISNNDNSVIKPKAHSDGRIIIMDYDQPQRAIHRHLNRSQGRKYVVHTDISNFYLSIYSHAIPWALVGISEAKKNKGDHEKWYNKLDRFQRLCKRDETMGVPIGPATSNIFAECILKKIDDSLASSGYVFSRFIDDYTAYCQSSEESEKFISDLSEELKAYKLALNIKKTYIRELPTPSAEDWISDLSTRLPKTKKINYFDVIKFLDYAVHIQNETPDGSVLKYALKSISKRAEVRARLSVAKYALNLAYKKPIVIPLLDPLILGLNKIPDFDLEVKLLSILKENIANNRSDGICWCVFLIMKFCGTTIPNDIADDILKTRDCLSITTLYVSGGHDPKIISFTDAVINRGLFDIDEQWMLFYQLFYDGKIPNPYGYNRLYDNAKTEKESSSDAMKRDILCFNILKRKKVSFIDTTAMNHSKMNILKSHLLRILYSNIRKKIAA